MVCRSYFDILEMSLRKDTLLRAHSLPDPKYVQTRHQELNNGSNKECNRPKKTFICDEGTEKKLRRRSVFSIPVFSPFRRSSSKKSRSLEGSPDAPVWKGKNWKPSPLCANNTACNDISQSPKHAPYVCGLGGGDQVINMTQNDAELMVSANKLISKSNEHVFSDRNKTVLHEYQKLASMTHEDLMEHVRSSGMDFPDSQASLGSDQRQCGTDSSLDLDSAQSSPRNFKKDNSMSPSYFEYSPETRGESDSEANSDIGLHRNLSLPIRVQHAFTSSSPSAIRKFDGSKIPWRSLSDGCRTPRKFKVYHPKTDNMTHQEYIRSLSAYLPRDTNNNPDNSSNSRISHDSGDIVFVPLNSAFYSAESTPIQSAESTPLDSPLDSPSTPSKHRHHYKLFGFSSPKYRKSPSTSPKKSPTKSVSPRKSKASYYDPGIINHYLVFFWTLLRRIFSRFDVHTTLFYHPWDD